MNSIRKDRIKILTRSREDFFNKYIKTFYDMQELPNSSFFFHKKVLETYNQNLYTNLFSNDHYFEYIYATLATWGMDRLFKSASLQEFHKFKQSAIHHKELLEKLASFKINQLDEKSLKEIKKDILELFNNLIIMRSDSKIVGLSKTLHHFLPELILPIDRKYTINFFYKDNLKGYPNINKNDEENMFISIFEQSYYICKELNLTKADLKNKWDTSIPKLIDNAIIGFVLLHKNS
ncbi:MAG: hypothetical protein EU535_07520 [Promethearchaeota archaeon]|nr:MAG: hypothetical protein EU535_07520 [Candidatus Lokiarchaeota archaeon]